MKNHINTAETCLYLLSFFSFVGVVYAFINYGTLTNPPQNNNVSFLAVVVIPGILSLLFGFAFHFCAKFVKLGNAKAWKCSVILLGIFWLKSLIVLLVGSSTAGLFGVMLASVGLWALVHKGSRAFVKSASNAG